MFDRFFLPIYMLTGLTALFIFIGFMAIMFLEKKKRLNHNNKACRTAENAEKNRFRSKRFTAKHLPFYIDGKMNDKVNTTPQIKRL